MHRKKVSIIKEECFRYTVSKRPLWQKPLIFARRFFFVIHLHGIHSIIIKSFFLLFFVLNYTSFLLCIQLQNFPGSASSASTHWGKINFLFINSTWFKDRKIVGVLSKFSSKSNFWKVLFLPQCVLLPLLFAESRGLVFWPISFGKMQIKLSVRRSGGRMCVEKQREVLLPAELVLFLLYLLYQEQNCIIKVVHHRGRYTISPKEPRKLFSMRTWELEN